MSACSGAGGGIETSELTVFAASSLTAAFSEIGKDFEAANPGVSVTFNFGPSDGLAAQIESEGTADVFASASPSRMDDVASKVGVRDRSD
ncbi:MAG TPA: extracellular solute-binding protein, partial [Actinomycetota bacterium]